MKVGDLVRDSRFPYVYGLVTNTTTFDKRTLVMIMILGTEVSMPYSTHRLEVVTKENA